MNVHRYVRQVVALVAGITLLVTGVGRQGAYAQASTKLELGSAMPMQDRQMRNAVNSQISIGRAAGQEGTLVVFWSNTCPWVDRYEERLVSLANQYRERGIGVVAVNANDPQAYPDEAFSEMQQKAADGDYPFPYVVDEGSTLARMFGASRTPEVFLFDGQRDLVYTGTIDDSPRTAEGVDEAYLRDALDAVLEGSDIPQSTTKAFGCTIKWSG